MAGDQKVKSISAERQEMLRLMQWLNHGWMYGVIIRRGQPVLDPPPKTVRTVKFPGVNGPRHEVCIADFVMKDQVREFFGYLDLLGDGVIEVLEIRDGLPVAGAIEETLHLN